MSKPKIVCICFVLAACQGQDSRTEAKLAGLENRIEALESKRTVDPENGGSALIARTKPEMPEPRFELVAGDLKGERRLYATADACAAAEQALEAAAAEREAKSRAEGAVFVSPYEATCLPLG